jgi:hypothetical protein
MRNRGERRGAGFTRKPALAEFATRLVRSRTVRLVGATVALRCVDTELRRMVLRCEDRRRADTCDEAGREHHGDKLALHYFPPCWAVRYAHPSQSPLPDTRRTHVHQLSEKVCGHPRVYPRAHASTSGKIWHVSCGATARGQQEPPGRASEMVRSRQSLNEVFNARSARTGTRYCARSWTGTRLTMS